MLAMRTVRLLLFLFYLLALWAGQVQAQGIAAAVLEEKLLFEELNVQVRPTFEGSPNRMTGRTDEIQTLVDFNLRNFIFRQETGYGTTNVRMDIDFWRVKKVLHARGFLRFYNRLGKLVTELPFQLSNPVKGTLRSSYFNDLAIRCLNSTLKPLQESALYRAYMDFKAIRAPENYPAYFEFARRYPEAPYRDLALRLGAEYRYQDLWPRVDSIEIVPRSSSTTPGGEVLFGMKAYAGGQYVGATANIEDYGQLNWGDFTNEIRNAVEDKNQPGRLLTQSDITLIRHHFVDLRMRVPARAAFVRPVEASWPIFYPGGLTFNFSGADGRAGQPGPNGTRGGLEQPQPARERGYVWLGNEMVPEAALKGPGARGLNGAAGGPGGNGANGAPGANAQQAQLTLTSVMIHDRPHLKGFLTVNGKVTNLLFDPATGGVSIQARGGDGGAGGNGGSGGRGGDGQDGANGYNGADGAPCKSGGNGGPGGAGGNGGKGGNGGNGGNGGQGGNGGSILVVADASVGQWIQVITADVHQGAGGAAGQGGAGGQGGNRGRGGKGGKGGRAGTCTQPVKEVPVNGADGPDGPNGLFPGRAGVTGRPGSRGPDGQPGTFRVTTAPVTVGW